LGTDRVHDWAELKRLWLSGKYKNIGAMAKGENISKSTLAKRAWEDKWIKKRDAIKEKVDAKIEEKTIQVTASKYAHIIEQHFKYADILIGLGFNNFKGKRKIKSESNALASIRLGAEMQRRALRGFAPDEDDAGLTPIAGPVFNQQINIYSELKPVNQVNQIADTISILVERGIIPPPKNSEVDDDE